SRSGVRRRARRRLQSMVHSFTQRVSRISSRTKGSSLTRRSASSTEAPSNVISPPDRSAKGPPRKYKKRMWSPFPTSVSTLRLPQHPDQHRPERPVLLAVDQQFSEGTGLGVPPVGADRVRPVEVGQREDAE